MCRKNICLSQETTVDEEPSKDVHVDHTVVVRSIGKARGIASRNPFTKRCGNPATTKCTMTSWPSMLYKRS